MRRSWVQSPPGVFIFVIGRAELRPSKCCGESSEASEPRCNAVVLLQRLGFARCSPNSLEAMDTRAKAAIGQCRWSGTSLSGEPRRDANAAVPVSGRGLCDLRELQIMEFKILVEYAEDWIEQASHALFGSKSASLSIAKPNPNPNARRAELWVPRLRSPDTSRSSRNRQRSSGRSWKPAEHRHTCWPARCGMTLRATAPLGSSCPAALVAAPSLLRAARSSCLHRLRSARQGCGQLELISTRMNSTKPLRSGDRQQGAVSSHMAEARDVGGKRSGLFRGMEMLPRPVSGMNSSRGWHS